MRTLRAAAFRGVASAFFCRETTAVSSPRLPTQSGHLANLPFQATGKNSSTGWRFPLTHAALDLRDSLRDSLTKTNVLIASLRRQKRQSKLVATTLASLKQLQAVG